MGISTQKIKLTSDASGDVVETVRMNGYIAGVETVNDGTATPTDQWDLSLTDEQSTVLFTDAGIGNAANEFQIPALGTYFKYPISGTLTLTGANMGNTKIAYVILYIED